jgi:asparagine synthetase B (glutamine-hydrolysing)
MAELSNILDNGKLIPYEKWSNHIDSLRTGHIIKDEKKAISELKPILENAIQKRIPNEKFGILFSGGVDSTLIAFICKKHTDNFICYTVGMKGSKDVEFSSKVAKSLKLNHKIKIFSQKEAEKIFEDTAKILGKELINIVNLGVGGVVLAAIKLAEKDKLKVFFSGLGSEEIFAGYQRHENSDNINEECWKGLKTTWQRDFRRDYAISKRKKIKLLTPFLDKELILTAMKIDSNLKIKRGTKKYILRKVAEEICMKKEFAFRPKTAAQYGSNFDKAIAKTAKTKGFRYKKEYLNYLASLCNNE